MRTLEAALSHRPHQTAKQLAKLMSCSVPTVYRRVRAAKDAGARISETVIPSGKTGPDPVLFSLVLP